MMSFNGDDAVFAHLDEIRDGEVMRLKWEDGNESVYQDFDNVVVDAGDPGSLQLMAPPQDTITLISCGGAFVADSENPLGGSLQPPSPGVPAARRRDNGPSSYP